jgi:hypothetical protein
MTGVLQSVNAIDEADCQPGDRQRRMYATVMLSAFESNPVPSRTHLLLAVPPRFWAAFFILGCIYAAERGCV